MKNFFITFFTTLVCSSVYSQTNSDTLRESAVLDTFNLKSVPQEVAVDTTGGIKMKVINDKVYYTRETQKITIKHDEND